MLNFNTLKENKAFINMAQQISIDKFTCPFQSTFAMFNPFQSTFATFNLTRVAFLIFWKIAQVFKQTQNKFAKSLFSLQFGNYSFELLSNLGLL